MNKITDRLRGGRAEGSHADQQKLGTLERRISELEREVEECRQVNRRLADLVDVVTELLVPAMARDDARVEQALARLGAPENQALS